MSNFDPKLKRLFLPKLIYPSLNHSLEKDCKNILSSDKPVSANKTELHLIQYKTSNTDLESIC